MSATFDVQSCGLSNIITDIRELWSDDCEIEINFTLGSQFSSQSSTKVYQTQSFICYKVLVSWSQFWLIVVTHFIPGNRPAPTILRYRGPYCVY